ncbi:MAG: glycosyltransferase [bacterium]|nr:glycosyltransferase [bacterium]
MESRIDSRLCICICTYQRPHLLKQELLDLFAQTVHPACLIIVNGDPASPEVRDMLCSLEYPPGWKVVYVPSNHGNLSYQRYLGWRAAAGYDVLVYFDDDLRVPKPDSLAQVIAPYQDMAYRDVVGVTALTHARGWNHFQDPEIVQDLDKAPRALVRWMGASSGLLPGDISSVGNRIYPVPQSGDPYAEVRWLQGRVMAYRMQAMHEDTFSDDLFALDEIRCGLGEDTYLSRQVGAHGRLLISTTARFDHPDEDTPKSYPVKAYKLAYARAYSRRFLNDHYRVTEPPRLSDRFDLVKSYVGNMALNWVSALRKRKARYTAYAWGYTRGALRGLLQKPTARALTPTVNWRADAERALAGRQTLSVRYRPAGE